MPVLDTPGWIRWSWILQAWILQAWILWPGTLWPWILPGLEGRRQILLVLRIIESWILRHRENTVIINI